MRTISAVPTTEDSEDESDETLTLTLTNTSEGELADATATGTIRNREVQEGLTASFSGMPSSHSGSSLTFGLTFSEEVAVGYQMLRDVAFDVTGGAVQKARRNSRAATLGGTSRSSQTATGP